MADPSVPGAPPPDARRTEIFIGVMTPGETFLELNWREPGNSWVHRCQYRGAAVAKVKEVLEDIECLVRRGVKPEDIRVLQTQVLDFAIEHTITARLKETP